MEDAFLMHQKIDSIISGESKLLDKYEIENVLFAIHSFNKKIDFLKELKKRRNNLIDDQISSLEEKISKLQDSIKQCLFFNKEKSLDFPGVGKVQTRTTKGSWTILNEDDLLKELQSIGKLDSVAESIWKINKKNLNKLLDVLEENNNLPKSVQKENDKQTLSISFPKDENLEDRYKINENLSSKPNKSEYDALEI